MLGTQNKPRANPTRGTVEIARAEVSIGDDREMKRLTDASADLPSFRATFRPSGRDRTLSSSPAGRLSGRGSRPDFAAANGPASAGRIAVYLSFLPPTFHVNETQVASFCSEKLDLHREPAA